MKKVTKKIPYTFENYLKRLLELWSNFDNFSVIVINFIIFVNLNFGTVTVVTFLGTK